MSEFKGTQGPWLRTVGAFVYALNERGTNVFWAHVQPGWKGKDAESSTSPEETEANAKLIAAAPDLLEALQELRDLMQGVIDGDYEPDSVTLQIADAAIAKATA